MRTLDSYFEEYSESHQNPTNAKIHLWCVPLITWSVLGFFWTFSLPFIPTTPAHLMTIAAIVYYAVIGDFKIAALVGAMLLIFWITYMLVPHLRLVSVVVFIGGWAGQFYGHKIEGKKPSFFKDLQFLLIGPAWVLQKLFDPKSQNPQPPKP